MNVNPGSMRPEGAEVTNQQLIDDFSLVVSDAEALIKATASQGGEALALVREKAEASLAMAKTKLVDAKAALAAHSREAVQEADNYVHENPWQSIGMAAGVGLIIGFLMGRR